MQRALAYHHLFGASKRQVEEAFNLIEAAGSAQNYLIGISRERRRFRDYEPAELVAVEMAVSDVAEGALAVMTLEEQQSTWSREEELARIIDQELTPV